MRRANCVAGEDFGATFSSFTQVGACNAVAFFTAANAAIKAGKLTVPAPGTARDGKPCLTTRSFALIDQDQSDNVTTEYLTQADGRTAQDTAVNRRSLRVAATLFNGSDNGLLDLFVDPALGCSAWKAPDLADNGAPAPALPLDELQAAAWAGRHGSGPAALVPLNDPMTLDVAGRFSTDKTDTYRSLVDMPPLPVGESPSGYCSDMERVAGTRLQRDVNLLLKAPSPVPAAADNLFTFLAMRLRQSFTNLNCGSFGMRNDVSTTADGQGVVVAACFRRQAAPLTPGPGNPMAGRRKCPATSAGPSSPSPVTGSLRRWHGATAPARVAVELCGEHERRQAKDAHDRRVPAGSVRHPALRAARSRLARRGLGARRMLHRRRALRREPGGPGAGRGRRRGGRRRAVGHPARPHVGHPGRRRRGVHLRQGRGHPAGQGRLQGVQRGLHPRRLPL